MTTPVEAGQPAARGGRHRVAIVAVGLLTAGLVVWLLSVSAAQRTTAAQAAGAEIRVAVAEPAAVPSPTRSPAGTAGRATAARQVSPGWAASVAARTGIPVRAVLAYANAQLRLADEQRGCGLSWNTLAAIGAVESGHASHGGAVLLASGRTDRPIRGPVLDGDGVGAVRDTDAGRLDGNATWDRAIGPMQFIPATWRRWAADGNGDGVADPDQLDDAALAAGRYLCASGRLDTPQGWLAAVYAYNRSASYVQKVADTANGYAAEVS